MYNTNTTDNSSSSSWVCNACNAVNDNSIAVCATCGYMRGSEIVNTPEAFSETKPVYPENPPFTSVMTVPKKKSKGPVIAICVVSALTVITVVLAAILFKLNFGNNGDVGNMFRSEEEIKEMKLEEQYKEAQDAFDDGDFKKAAELFSGLPHDYKDSSEMVLESKYQNALELLEAGNTADAKPIFKELNDYSDAAEKAKECTYKEADNMIQSGDFKGAYDYFNSISGYSDSAERAKECAYNCGLAKIEEGNYKGARYDFISAGDYSDASEQVKECDYLTGEAHLAAGEYLEAMKVFALLDTYKDSSSRFSYVENQLIAQNKSGSGIKDESALIGSWKSGINSFTFSKDVDGNIKFSCSLPADDGEYFSVVNGVHSHGNSAGTMKKQWIYQKNTDYMISLYHYSSKTVYSFTKDSV